jgi:hypothetical protein
MTDDAIFPFPSYFLSDFLCSLYCCMQGAFGFDDFIFTSEKNWQERTTKGERLRGSGKTQDFGIDASVSISWDALK